MKDFILEYESEFDILSAYSPKKDKVAGTIPLDNILIDISEKGEIIGIQIEEASSFLKISKEILIKETEKKVKKEYLLKLERIMKQKFIEVGSIKEFKERYLK
jgi:uncharacterized protein YuzE